MLKFRLTVLLILLYTLAMAQPLVRITGIVSSEDELILPQVTISIIGQAQSTTTDEFGGYTIYSKTRNFYVKYTLLGYQPQIIKFSERTGARLTQNVVLKVNPNELEQVNITNKQNQLSNTKTLNTTSVYALPSVSGNFQSMLKSLPGVSTNNELSSTYSVRGGNFDENLIYVNDIEITRPMLVRNGQQEGLSFINSDLVSRAKFSAGGFEAKYGDKLSSVLDVKYDKPDSSETILSTSFLNSSIATKFLSQKSFLLAGFRYKNNGSILKTQDVKGSYRPNFADFQFLYQYDISEKFNINVLGNANVGKFNLIPTNRETTFGTSNTTMKLDVDYDGREDDIYKTYGGAVTATYSPKPNVVIKFINSYFKTEETENFNLNGQYNFYEINSIGTNSSLENFNKGIGAYYNYANNSLKTDVFTSEIKVDQNYNSHVFSWGLKFDQNKSVNLLDEYNYIDSTRLSVIPNTREKFYENVIKANHDINIKNYSAYIQDSYSLSPRTELQLGARGTYNSLSRQFLLSPRLMLAYRPISNNKIFRFSAGIYQQAPSFRTILDISGALNLNQKAQRSFNTSFGYDYAFDGLGTRLKFSSEAYFKYSDRLIPYKVDNISIKYLANEISEGFTYGADFSIGGEFVKDLVSFFRLSLMKANENILNDAFMPSDNKTTEPGFIKRNTDQRLNFSFFFQDKLLNSPTYKVHLNALYGSRLPIGPVNTPRYSDKYYIPAYKRLDIGFSKDFLDDDARYKPAFLTKNFSSIIVFVEVFNLLNIDNTVSYLWLKDFNKVQYAIPNYLTSRQLNLKLIVKFKNNK
jgi:hypothetical protein